MSNTEIQEIDDGLELARKMAEEEEGISRKPLGLEKWVIPFIAVTWSLFQLSIASWLMLDSTYIRSIHLGFALLIVFLNFPIFKKKRFGLNFLSVTDRIPFFDYIIAIVACLSALYIVLDFEGITTRYGAPIQRDIVIGILLTILLLEAARRVIGPALPIIAIFFLCLCLSRTSYAGCSCL